LNKLEQNQAQRQGALRRRSSLLIGRAIPFALFASCPVQAIEPGFRAVSTAFDAAGGQPSPLSWSSRVPFALLRCALPKQRGEPGAFLRRQRQQGRSEGSEALFGIALFRRG
jgi:hypothetical protein